MDTAGGDRTMREGRPDAAGGMGRGGPGRRAALGLGVASLAGRGGPAAAQALNAGAAPPNAVLPLPLPCADRPGDVVGLVLEGTGSPAGHVCVFGQPLRPGDLPRGTRLVLRMADSGRVLRSQVDVPTRHTDGSARFAVVSAQLPAPLNTGDRLGLVLSTAPEGPAEAPLDLDAALAGRQAVVEISTAPEFPRRETWRLDLLALLPRRASANPANGTGGGGGPWQAGPLAVQWRVTAAVPPAVADGATSLRMVADIALRADGTLWVDLWFRNDIAMRPGGGDARYAVRVLLDGVEALAATPGRHVHYTAWGRTLIAAPGGRPALWQPWLRPNAGYLAETGVVARYDLSTGVDPALFQTMTRLMQAPAWKEPFPERGIARYMPGTGARADIGPVTDWQAAWLITGEPRAAAFIIGQAEGSGAIPWHFWDREGGEDRRGGWLNVRRWPNLWTDPRGGRPPLGLLNQIATDTGWTPDIAHQPDLAFVPYLMTGRRALLDHVLSQGARSIVALWPGYRNPPNVAQGRGRDVILVHVGQVRGQAWGLRQLDQAAWVAPDGDPDQAYFRESAAANWAWLRGQLAGWTERQGEPHGWVPGENGGAWGIPPWQQDYLASTVAAAARRGNADARAVLGWMANFLVGRFKAEARGLPMADGAAYTLTIATDESRETLYRSWAEIGAAMRARNIATLDGWAKADGNYIRVAQHSLALLAEILDDAEAKRVLVAIINAQPPRARPADFAQAPASNVLPRGLQRLPGRIKACTPAQAVRG
jgi:hypothetical protein